MSLKYRLIILTIVVFALTFGVGTLLGVRAAGRLAETQLRDRLANSASALATSGAPLNDDVLARFGPLLDAEIMVIDSEGGLLAHSQADWPWDEICENIVESTDPDRPVFAAGQMYYHASSVGRLPATGDAITVVLLADKTALAGPTRTILRGYLVILGVTSLLLAVGMYILGLGLVGRIKRLNRTVDEAFSDDAGQSDRRGDELSRLSEALEDLLGRLDRSRERLLAQQHLATTGKIASSVAHEVRNPLQAMKLTVQMLREKCPSDARDGCDLIISEIDRLTLLTDELLVLAGKSARRVEEVNLVSELDETVRLLRFQFRQREIRVKIDLTSLPMIRMDRNRCRQLLLNLLLNAAEASPRGQTIRVVAKVQTDEHGWHGQVEAKRKLGRDERVTEDNTAKLHSVPLDRATHKNTCYKLLVLRISDSGSGFPKEVLQGYAEEFFSTKTTGAGLGLSICRRIVDEAGGRMKLYNSDTGAVAEIVLPVGENKFDTEAQRDRD